MDVKATVDVPDRTAVPFAEDETQTKETPQGDREYRESGYRWIVIGLLSFSYLMVYVHRMCPAVLAQDLIKSFNATGAMAGLMASAYFYPYALMQVPSGVLADKLGPRLLVTICMIVASVGSVLFALADTVTTAFMARVLVGLGLSAVLVPSYKALTAWFSGRHYVMATSIVISVAGLGGVVAGSPLGWLSEQIGWRGSFHVIAGMTLVTALLVWFLVRNKPQDFGLPAVEKPAPSSGPAKSMPLGRSFGTILGSLDFWLMAIWFFFNGAVLFSFAGLWSGPYFMQVYGMSKTAAGNFINIFSFGWIFGPLAFGWLATRFPSNSRILGGSMFGMALLSIWIYLRNGTMSVIELYTFNSLFGLLGAGPAGVCFAAVKERFPIEISGTATGLLYVFPMAGSALYQPLAGAILDRSGHLKSGLGAGDFSALFIVYIVSCAVAGLAGLMLRRKKATENDLMVGVPATE
ncbi:MFS transporter [Desulfosarcina ovata]|uniref:Lysosomal dipeptide transporter MFSD1 n=1 Tax=Desulfosarcina ovata subsp. ovata TaxID=2752305 RepID=A0A5K8AHT9_9BACT|nr:MFS transporter [Desulfosarcina ovata]BBO92237.1 MFS transporter [Desulfosarcina ovata subsp. ovata]